MHFILWCCTDAGVSPLWAVLFGVLSPVLCRFSIGHFYNTLQGLLHWRLLSRLYGDTIWHWRMAMIAYLHLMTMGFECIASRSGALTRAVSPSKGGAVDIWHFSVDAPLHCLPFSGSILRYIYCNARFAALTPTVSALWAVLSGNSAVPCLKGQRLGGNVQWITMAGPFPVGSAVSHRVDLWSLWIPQLNSTPDPWSFRISWHNAWLDLWSLRSH